jgi:hypothetical protein
MIAYLNRQSKSYATFRLEDGRVWDVYGDNWAEMVEEAHAIINDAALEISEIEEHSLPPETED